MTSWREWFGEWLSVCATGGVLFDMFWSIRCDNTGTYIYEKNLVGTFVSPQVVHCLTLSTTTISISQK